MAANTAIILALISSASDRARARLRSHNDVRLHPILHGAAKGEALEAWQYNLSYKRFKNVFGNAVKMDHDLHDNSWEWRRRVQGCERDHVFTGRNIFRVAK